MLCLPENLLSLLRCETAAISCTALPSERVLCRRRTSKRVRPSKRYRFETECTLRGSDVTLGQTTDVAHSSKKGNTTGQRHEAAALLVREGTEELLSCMGCEVRCTRRIAGDQLLTRETARTRPIRSKRKTAKPPSQGDPGSIHTKPENVSKKRRTRGFSPRTAEHCRPRNADAYGSTQQRVQRSVPF